MKIKKVIASDFGCLSGNYSLFDDITNVIVEANEQGKSTLVAAILAGLYGFPPSRERKKLPEEKAYRPWKGGSYRVGLEVEDDAARPLRIDRDFGGKSEKVKVTDLSTNKDVTQEFRARKSDFRIGERLLGISREVFMKTCLVRQLEIEEVREKSSSLVSKVQQIFDTSGGKGTAAAAISVLEAAIRKYSGTQLKVPGMIETEINRLKKDIREQEALMNELIEEREKAAPSMNELRGLRSRLEELEVRREHLEYLTRRAEIAEIESALKANAENRAELDKLIKRRESLKQYADFPKEKASDFARLAGRLDELGKQRKEREDSLGKLKKDLEATISKLKEFRGFEALGEDFKTRLHDLSMELKRLGEEAAKKRQELSQFEESLRSEGNDLSEIEELLRKFSKLSVEDKDFLRDSEAEIPRMETRFLELEGTQRQCRKQLRGIKRAKRALLAAGAAFCFLGMGAIVASDVTAGLAAVGVGGTAIALALLLPGLKSRKVRELRAQEDAARENLGSLTKERDTLTEKLAHMAPKAGFETTSALTQAFKRWGRLQDRAMRLGSLRKEAESAGENLVSCREKASSELKKMGVHVPPAELDLTVVQKAEGRVTEFLEITFSLRQKEESHRKLQAKIQELDEEEKRLQKPIRDILAAAKLPQNLPPEEALPKVQEASEKSENFHRLATKQIPQRQQGLLSPEKVDEKTERLASLKVQIEKMVCDKPELADLEVVEGHSQYEEEARGVAAEIAKNSDEKGKISREVLNVEDRYREEYPRLANKIADLKETRDKTERFQESISIAIETLERISSKSHALWASSLNPRANEILQHLNPRCRELKFDSDLSFTVVPGDGTQPMDKKHIEAQQSVGAKHQIYLAVRLALSDYLSSGGKGLPVILDDPFATSDDDRFLSGMNFLCREFRKNHQLIILTCHRQRHTDLIRQIAPDLLDDLRIVPLTSSS